MKKHNAPDTRTIVTPEPVPVKCSAPHTRIAWAIVNGVHRRKGYAAPMWKRNPDSTEAAGHPVYFDTVSFAWVSDLGTRLEYNAPDGTTTNVWIEDTNDKEPLAPVARLDFDNAKRAYEEALAVWRNLQAVAADATEAYKANPTEANRADAAALRRLAKEAEDNVSYALMDSGEYLASGAARYAFDPDGANAEERARRDAERGTISGPSNSGFSPALAKARRGIHSTSSILKNAPKWAEVAISHRYNKKGDFVQDIAPSTTKAGAGLLATTSVALPEGADLLATAWTALWEQTVNHEADEAAAASGWLDEEYKRLVIAKHIVTNPTEAPKYKEETLTPAKAASREVGRYIRAEKSVTADPRSPFTYSTATDEKGHTIDGLYYRSGRYDSVANPDEYGITAGEYTMKADRALLEKLSLSVRELRVYNWLTNGMEAIYYEELESGEVTTRPMHIYKPSETQIMDALDVSETTVKRIIASIRAKCYNAGFAPKGYNPGEVVGTAPKWVACLSPDRDNPTTLAVYPSLAAAAKATGADSKAIGKVCANKRNYAGGYRWEWCNAPTPDTDKK